MKQQRTRTPKARKDKLLVQELHGELLIYDLETDKAHCLNQTAALIWKRCDGRTSISDLAKSVRQEINAPIDERVIQLALKQLSRDHLLDEKFEIPLLPTDLSRRALVRRLGIAAVLLPLVTTISAPTALAGNSCPPGNCTTDAECGAPSSGCVCSQVFGTCVVA